jgi:AcrR family transcriptional regulator
VHSEDVEQNVELDEEPNGDAGRPGDDRVLSLRERKKLATREALGAAAMRLALERGFDNVRVEDIAEAAGVSPRTFNNYFSSREQAICALRNAHVERIATALRARPPEEPLLDALINAVLADHGHGPNRDVAKLIHCTPSLAREFVRNVVEAQIPLMEAIADRTGTAPDDLLPAVISTTVLGAQRVAMHRWMQSDEADSPSYKDLLRDALNQLRALAEPTQATAGGTVSAAVSPASGPPLIMATRED